MTSAELLLHPLRLRIVQAFLGDRALTVAQLADELGDVSSASLYRHVSLLTTAGVLHVVSERRVRAVVERTYKLRLDAARIQPDEVATMTPEQHLAAFTAYVAGMLGDVERYLTTGKPDPMRDGASYRIGAMWLTDAELADLVLELQAVFLTRIANRPTKGRRRRTVYSVLVPEPQEDEDLSIHAYGTEVSDRTEDKKSAEEDSRGGQGGAVTKSSDPGSVALEVVNLARQGRFDAIRERLSPPLQALASADALKAAWDAELAEPGAVVSFAEPIEEPQADGTVVVKVPIMCERGGIAVIMSVARNGILASIQLAPLEAATPTPTWEPPAYADASGFTEREVALGTGQLAVSGTLSLPLASGRHPAVVLLAGSGPLDRDETIGPNKPLKDLAWGLATRGIAAARFDKVTFAHPNEVRRAGDFTLSDEYIPAALAAIEALRGEPGVDADLIFVAGHSLGGTAAPRVAAADGSIRGLVILAGGAMPLHRSIVRQVRYLASLDEASGASTASAIAVLERQANLIDSDELSAATPASELPLGTPAAYWLDLRHYDPVAVASALGRPILVVQGGRDYQSTIDDDLALWRAGLAGRSNATVRVYQADNHLLAPGSGPPTPAEYGTAQHVDAEVVADIAEWLTKAATSPGSTPGRPPGR